MCGHRTEHENQITIIYNLQQLATMGEILSQERDKISIYFKVSFAISERKSRQGFI